jgi:sortase A
MTKKRAILITSIALFIISIILITYSIILIKGSNDRAAEMLDEWDALMDQQSSNDNDSSNTSSNTSSSTVISSQESSINSSEKSSVSVSKSSNPTTKIKYKPELFCLITFPTIDNRKVVVVNGTTNKDLRGSAGHAKSSVNPGEIGNCLIFGHRDGVFRGFGKLKVGDKIIINTKKEKFEYTIIRMQVLSPKDMAIHKNSDNQKILTLVTCYPFNYIGAAPFRYVVKAQIK